MSTRRSATPLPPYASLALDEADARIVAWSAGDAGHERYLSRTLGRVAHLVFCRTEPALADEIAKGGNAIVLVELAEGAVPPVASVIQGVKRRAPAVPVLGYCWLGPAVSAEIVASARAGLDELVLRGYDDLVRVVRRALARERGDDAIVLLELESMLPPEMLSWARVVLERAREGPNVGVVARALGCGPRTLERAAQEQGVASPAKLIACVRLLFAARLLTYRRLGVDEAAARSGYPSGVALRRAFRHEGLPAPTDLRTPSRYALVREALRRRIRVDSAEVPAESVHVGSIRALA
jgi:AraC-like DNA-binding protein